MKVNLNVNGDTTNIIAEGELGILAIGLEQLRLMHMQRPTEALQRDIEAYEYMIGKNDVKLVRRYQAKRKELIAANQPAKVAEVLKALE